MHAFIAISQQGKELLYPKWSELILGAIAFFILFAFMARWVLPRVNAMLEERRRKIQGDLEKAEESRHEADRLLQEYRQNLAGAREEANRIIEESRRTAEAYRQDMTKRAEQEYQALQEEIERHTNSVKRFESEALRQQSEP